jgi:ABC-2 type transport system permease protein
MLGGAMWPLEIVGPVMRAIGHLTPHAWALDAFVDLMGNRVSATAILPQVAVLVLFSAALLPLAGFRLRRAIGA